MLPMACWAIDIPGLGRQKSLRRLLSGLEKGGQGGAEAEGQMMKGEVACHLGMKGRRKGTLKRM